MAGPLKLGVCSAASRNGEELDEEQGADQQFGGYVLLLLR